MKRLAALSIAAALMTAPVMAQAPAGTPQGMSVSTWYKQTVYDAAKNSVGDVKDVLVTPDGKATSLVVGVGGFLGMGEKSVVVPFETVKQTMQDGKPYLTIDTTKEAMKAAPGYTYDSKSMMWVADAAERPKVGTQ